MALSIIFKLSIASEIFFSLPIAIVKLILYNPPEVIYIIFILVDTKTSIGEWSDNYSKHDSAII